MNFIKHFLMWMEYVYTDERLTPHHISLYFALFHYWNTNHFKNPISINREEMMQLSKIGSVNTYTKCLKELDSWHYISYVPSFNALRGSKVHLYTFDKGTDKAGDKAGNKADDKACEMVVRPSINKLNNTNIINSLNHELQNEKSDLLHNGSTAAENQLDTHPGKKRFRQGASIPATIEEAANYFQAQKSTAMEAEKFFNYFLSIGWKIGGRAPMTDWQAAARNWILNAPKFEKRGKSNLHVSTDKDYDEPL